MYHQPPLLISSHKLSRETTRGEKATMMKIFSHHKCWIRVFILKVSYLKPIPLWLTLNDDLKSHFVYIDFVRVSSWCEMTGSFSRTSELSPVAAEHIANCPALLSVYHWCGPHNCLFVLIDWVRICRHVAQDWLCSMEVPKAPTCLRTMNVNVPSQQRE